MEALPTSARDAPGEVWTDHDESHGPATRDRPDGDAPQRWNLDAVAATPRPHHLAVSPDGSRAVFVLDDHGGDLWLLPLPSGPVERLTTNRQAVGHRADTSPSWSPDGRAVAYVASGVVCVVGVDDARTRDLVPGEQPVWLDERHLVATVEHADATRLVVLDVDDPWPRPITRGPGDYGRAAVSPDGRLVAVAFRPADEPARRELRLVDVARGEERVVTGGADAADHPVWSPAGDAVAFVSDRSGWREIHLLELSGAAGKRVDAIGVQERQLTADGADFATLSWDGRSGRIGATRTREGATDVVRVEPDTGWVETVASGGTWSSPGWTVHDVMVAVHESETSPPAIARVATGRKTRPEPVFRPAPRAVAAAPHTRSVAVSFPSDDGTIVRARLLRPRTATATRRAPVIVAVHDGPAASAADAWDGLAQYFVARGYGWLAPDYRGSTGHGREFERAGHGGWGVDDAADCLFAGEYLAKLDWVDEERIAIVGRGYGGFLALGALTRDPGRRFAAGVCIGGDCDLLASWAGCDRARRREIEAMMGHPSAYRDAYRAGSPVQRLDALAVPVLVAHGARDRRVPVEQSRVLVNELRRLDATFEYVTYRTEGHVLTHPGPRLHLARRLERFLDWHLM